jgi:hypothetical protein
VTATDHLRTKLQFLHDTMMIFLDETGDEQYSDPKHPVFGIGGCALISDEYGRRIFDPWNRLKRDVLGLAGKPFHAVDFEHSKPTPARRRAQIAAINLFLTRGFYRLAVTTDINTQRPEGFDGHETVSTVVHELIQRLIARHSSPRCMVFFEHSERTAKMLERNLPVHKMDARNLFGEPVVPEGYTMPKKFMEPGLEIADLIIHTSGKQQRRHPEGYANGVRHFTLDFRAVFHSVDLSWTFYQSVTAMEEHNETQLMVDHWPVA